MKKALFLIISVFLCLSSRADIVAQADSAYLADDFLNAAALYEQSIQQLGPSADRYYNLGNAYYRAGLPGMAIVSYERALRIAPTNSDIRENLEFVNTKTTDRINQQSGLIGGAADRVASKLHPNVWTWAAVVSFLLALGGVMLYFSASGIMLRKAGFFGAGILLLICILTNVFGYRAAHRATAANQAVITAPSVILSTTPRTPKDRTEEALLLHEGTKVTILDSIASANETWFDVRVDNEHRAWIPASALEVI